MAECVEILVPTFGISDDEGGAVHTTRRKENMTVLRPACWLVLHRLFTSRVLRWQVSKRHALHQPSFR